MALPDSNNTQQEAFNRWRPRIHLIAPRGWLNDPCAPGYDPVSGKYHVGFQWNPDGWNWGNIAWGAATSEDLVNWKVSDTPSIAPSATEDHAGVFTGAITSARLSREGSQDHLSCFYTSAQGSIIHYTRPYQPGSEVLHAATSIDGGLSWQRHPSNPLLPGPPSHLSVTGWRDPYTFHSPQFDIARGLTPNSTLYGIISGGLRDRSPTIFLYTINDTDPTHWTFLSTLLEPGLNFCPTPLGGDFGINWEVANLTTLKDSEGREFTILIAGVEGCKVADAQSLANSHSIPRAARSGRSQNWLCGTPKESSDGIKLQHGFSGVLDWGVFYAANSFWDSIGNKRIIFGWILEEDLSDEMREEQGWSGCISLPRTLSMQTINGVDASCKAILDAVPGFTYCSDGDGNLKVTTICCKPASQLQTLRHGDAVALKSLACFERLEAVREDTETTLKLPGLRSLELDVILTSQKHVEVLGIDIFHSSDHKLFTRILFSPLQSLITISRSHSRSSTTPNPISLHNEIAHHAFLSLHDPTNKTVKPEDLEVRVFYDVSVLEVFVNGRTVVTTRVYPESGKCFGVMPWVVGKSGDGVGMERFEVWELRGKGC
ncbi:Arabinanase/levansucrase/invertase [Aureobasidium sp. EXF-3400]|nr:Arabinanase/levansucrase/invertase [Aureobasidium sp. EXF-12344]KAI4778080.1 Arabinanase/levansucrase/invertase [Aureobasidium sp. EXF-3400]